MEFTKNDTQICKGIAIILMIIHHLFAFNDRIKNGSYYISLFQIGGENIELLIARFGKICVAMFLFLSGYGIYIKWIKNKDNINFIIFEKIKMIYIKYWTIFLFFIPISFIIGIRKFKLQEFIYNFFGYSSSYNPEAWFFILYVLLIITFQFTIKLVGNGSINSLIQIMLISVVSRTIVPELQKITLLNEFFKTSFSKEFLLLIKWLPCFLVGCIFAKFNLFYKIKCKFRENNLDNIIIYIFIGVLVFYLRKNNSNVMSFDYLFAPLFIISSNNVVKILRLNRIFEFLGKHSTNIWLIHSYFCYQYFQKVIYYPKLSILIVIWLISICVVCSMLIMLFENKFKEFYHKYNQKNFLKNNRKYIGG